MVTSHLGSVAQLVERSTENRKVTGSTPVGATTGKHQFFGTGAFLRLRRGIMRLPRSSARPISPRRQGICGAKMNMRVPITPWHAVGCPFVAGQEAWPAQHLRAPQQKNLPCHEIFDLRQTVVA